MNLLWMTPITVAEWDLSQRHNSGEVLKRLVLATWLARYSVSSRSVATSKGESISGFCSSVPLAAAGVAAVWPKAGRLNAPATIAHKAKRGFLFIVETKLGFWVGCTTRICGREAPDKDSEKFALSIWRKARRERSAHFSAKRDPNLPVHTKVRVNR